MVAVLVFKTALRLRCAGFASRRQSPEETATPLSARTMWREVSEGAGVFKVVSVLAPSQERQFRRCERCHRNTTGTRKFSVSRARTLSADNDDRKAVEISGAKRGLRIESALQHFRHCSKVA